MQFNENDKEKLNRLEDIKTKLFSRNYKPRTHGHDLFSYRKKINVPDSWGGKAEDAPDMPEKIFMKTSIFKNFFIFSVVFFVLAAGFGVYTFLGGGNTVSNANIDISVLGNTFTAGGEELPLNIEITNKNALPLELADLIVEYPKNTAGPVGDTERMRQTLGTIPAGSMQKENVKIVLFGEQGSIQPVKISLEYRVEKSNAIFVKEKDFNVTISSAPINLILNAPTEANPNQDIVLNIKASLNATKVASAMLLRVDYPIGFKFEQATPLPTFNNNIWSLGDLAPGAEREIKIVGKMIDVSEGEEKTFHVWSGSQNNQDKSAIGIIFNSLSQTVSIKKPFIQAQFFINGVYQREYASDSKTPIYGEIRWVNNLPTAINDMQIKAKISGNAFNQKTINSQQGFYNSLLNTIIWDKNSDRTFAEVAPGASGSASFSVSPSSLFSSSGGLIVDPTINIDISVSGKQPMEGNLLQEVNNSESKIIRIISDVGLSTKALYYTGALPNTGPMPPKVDQETTYTIVWGLSNSANTISNAQVKSSLPQWARFVGPISPPSEDLTFNPATKEITWNIGTIPKNAGISGAGREVSFQIGITPSLSQLGTLPTFINDAILTGHDDFANVNVRVNRASLNSRHSSDSNKEGVSDRVVE